MTLYNYLFSIVMAGYALHEFLKYNTMFRKTNVKKYRVVSFLFLTMMCLIVIGNILVFFKL